MGLVFCPECKKKVSECAEACPDCGFPISKFIKDNNFTDFSKAFVCPKCADSYVCDDIPFQFKCEYCNTILVQTDMDRKELSSLGTLKVNEEKFRNKTIELAKKYGNNQFSQEKYNNRIIKLERDVRERARQRELKEQQSQNVPKCPKCGSTEIQVLPRMLGISKIFASNRVDRVCVNCKYRW